MPCSVNLSRSLQAAHPRRASYYLVFVLYLTVLSLNPGGGSGGAALVPTMGSVKPAKS